ncbi:MAG: 2-hydroxychromene-2-carboxylate isomerase [Myxococcota bacterium]
MAQLEFFFDCSSPWTYLAFHRIEEVCARAGASLIWRPILVGGVFNEANPSVYEQRANPVPVKARYYSKDLADWASHYGIAIGQPPVFPVNSVKAMRGAFLADEKGCLPEYARAVFEAYWGDLDDISQDDVLRAIVRRVGLDEEEFFERIARQETKDRLRANTDELIRRGGFGSPTMFVDGDDMYFGNDRLELVRAALSGESPPIRTDSRR